MLEVRMKPPPPAPPHVAALSSFWGRWGSEEPGLKTTNPSFLALCVCTLPLFPGPALPQGEEIISQKNRDQNIFPGPLSHSRFSLTPLVAVAVLDQLGQRGQTPGGLDARLTGFI